MGEDLEAQGERIAEMAAHLDAAKHRLLAELRAFDAAGGCARQGFKRCSEWLSWRVGWSYGAAREHVRVARKLGELPQLDEALRRGELSYCKVRAITRVATPANEATLVEDARFATGGQLDKICRKYQTVVRSAQERDESEDRKRRTVTRIDLEDGMVRLMITLRPEEADVVMMALERIAAERYRAERVTEQARAAAAPATVAVPAAASVAVPAAVAVPAPRSPMFNRVDALLAMAQDVIRGTSPRRSPTELIVTVPLDVLLHPTTAAEPVGLTAAGSYVSAETARRLACDCGVVHVHEDADGNALSVGRKTRTIQTPIKRALLQRDQTCRFPGCGNRLFVEGHHIKHWADGGETRLKNLVGLCDVHHVSVHEHGYRVELDAHQQPRFYTPHGQLIPATPPPAVPADLEELGWPMIEALNEGLDISAETPACGWDGRPVDYSAAIDALVRDDQLQ